MRGAIVFLVTLLLSSPAVAQQAAPPARSTGKSVCVLPLVGHKFAVKKIGIMIFGNALNEIAVESWGIDELIVRKAGAVLGKQFSARRINFPKGTLAALEKPGGGPFRDGNKELDEAVAATARASGKCDFILVAFRTGSQYANTNQALFGLGIMAHGTELVGSYFIHANFAIRVYDGRTFAVLKTQIARREPILVAAFTGVGGMSRKVDKTWWPDPPQAAAQSALIRDGIRALVNEGVEKTLPGML